jgi:hypothetical protein
MDIFGVVVPLWAVFLILIIAIIVAWKLIKFALKVLIVVIVFFLILFGLDLLGVFDLIQKALAGVV